MGKVRYCECIAETKYSLYFLLRNFTSLCDGNIWISYDI